MNKKRALLVASFGTSYLETEKKNIVAVEDRLREAFSEHGFFRAFTSHIIRAKLKQRDQRIIPGVPQALEEIIAQGYTELLVQSTHIIPGHEFQKVKTALQEYKSHFDVLRLGLPLLSDDEDILLLQEAVARATSETMEPDTALLLMGHGSDHEADDLYLRVQHEFHQKGLTHTFVGTVEGQLGLHSILPNLRALKTRNVLLRPLMLVAGDHAVNDMAGPDPDSWKSILQNEGYTVQISLQGLGELNEIRDLYLQHAVNGKEI